MIIVSDVLNIKKKVCLPAGSFMYKFSWGIHRKICVKEAKNKSEWVIQKMVIWEWVELFSKRFLQIEHFWKITISFGFR